MKTERVDAVRTHRAVRRTRLSKLYALLVGIDAYRAPLTPLANEDRFDGTAHGVFSHALHRTVAQ